MRLFVRIAAVFVALTNVYVLTTGGNPTEFMTIHWSNEVLLSGSITVLAAILAGLVTAEILLRSASSVLQGSYFLRYVAMVLGVCFGGTLYGMLSPIRVLFDGSFSLPERFLLFVGAGTVGALFGAVLGAAEGLILGLPLAGALGLFGNRR
jgi:hypothetical protein